MVDIARLGHANNRVDQQVGLRFTCGAEGKLLMRAAKGVARLERHDPAPAHLPEIGAQLIRRIAPGAEIIVDRLLQTDDLAAQIDRASRVVQVVDGGMRQIVGAIDFLSLNRLVRRVFRRHGHDRKDHTFLIAQRDISIAFDLAREVFRHIQRDRHWPQLTVRQTHVRDN